MTIKKQLINSTTKLKNLHDIKVSRAEKFRMVDIETNA